MDDHERARMRELFGRFATGVTVVAARHGPLLAGMTANAIASISVDRPPGGGRRNYGHRNYGHRNMAIAVIEAIAGMADAGGAMA